MSEQNSNLTPEQVEALKKITSAMAEGSEKAKKFKEKIDELKNSIVDLATSGNGLEELRQRVKEVQEVGHTLSEQYKKATEEVYRSSGSMLDLTTKVRIHRKALQDEVLVYKDKLKVLDEAIFKIREELATKELSEEQARDLTEALKELTEQQTEEIRNLEEATEKREAYDQISKSTKSTITALTGVNENWKKTMWGSVIASGSLTKGLTALVEQMSKQLSISNILGSTIMKVQEATVSYAKTENQADVALRKFNNASDESIDKTLRMARSNRALGFSAKEVAQNSNIMYEQVVSFSAMSQSSRDELAKLNSTMETFGVSANEAATLTAYLADNLSMSATEISQYQAEMANFGGKIGKSLSLLTKEFIASRKNLLLYGKDAISVFKKMSATAKSLRVTVEQLNGTFEDQYNTFEGAFTAAGRLNSLLAAEGRSLDPIGMMYTDVADRARTMVETLRGTRLAYDALYGPMAKHYKMAVASALQTQDMDLVTKVLKGDISDLTKTVDYAAESYKEFMSDEFLNKAKNQQDLWRKLKLAAEQFAISVLPLIRWFSQLITGFNEFMDAAGPVKDYFIGFVYLLAGTKALLVSISLIKALLTPITLLYAKSKAIETAVETAANATSVKTLAMAKAKAAASKGLMFASIGLGAALLGAGIGIGVAALGLSKLAKSFKNLEMEKIYALIGIVAVLGTTFVILGAKMLAASVPLGASAIPLMKFGVALLLIGGAIALASAGLAFLVGTLGNITLETGAAIALVAVGLAALTFVALKAGAVGFLAGLGLGVLLGTIAAFVYFISGSESNKALENLSNIFTGLANIRFLETAKGIRNISDSVKELASNMADLSDEEVARIVKVSTSFSGGSTQSTASGPVSTGPSVQATTTPSMLRPEVVTPSSSAAASTSAASNDFSSQIASLIAALEKFSKRSVNLYLNNRGERAIATVAEEAVQKKMNNS